MSETQETPIDTPDAPTTEPTAEVVAEPTAEVVAEPTAEVVAEPTAEVVAEPTAEVVAEPTAVQLPSVTEQVTAAIEATLSADPFSSDPATTDVTGLAGTFGHVFEKLQTAQAELDRRVKDEEIGEADATLFDTLLDVIGETLVAIDSVNFGLHVAVANLSSGEAGAPAPTIGGGDAARAAEALAELRQKGAVSGDLATVIEHLIAALGHGPAPAAVHAGGAAA